MVAERFQKTPLLCLLLAALGCRPTREAHCMSNASKSLALARTSQFIQGGYIHFKDKTCTASFELKDLASDRMTLKAYSARHCRFEKSGDNDAVSLSFYFDKTPQHSAGYVQKIRATEAFAERASKALQEFSSLNVGAANSWLTDALTIPVHYDPWRPPESRKTFAGADSIVCNNFDLIPAIPNSPQTLSQSCWTFLDLGVFDFTITKATVGDKDFNFISSKIAEKNKSLSNFLNENSTLSAYRDQFRRDADGVTGLLRLQKYARLGYLLNLDLCKLSGSATVDTRALCSVQRKLIEIVGQHLVELDEAGKQINIFDKLAAIKKDFGFGQPGLASADLLAGRRVALNVTTFAEADELARKFADDFSGLYQATTVVALESMRDALKKLSGSSDPKGISPALFVGTNFRAAGGVADAQLQYGQFPLAALSTRPEKIQFMPETAVKYDIEKSIFGVNIYGTLRLAIAKDSEVVSFLPTDSGSTLFLKGVIPVMFLNTVNDKPTSGGASILELPQVTEDTSPSAGNSRSVAAKNSNSHSAGDQQVKISKEVVSAGACN